MLPKNFDFGSTLKYTHTHTHTHIYIYTHTYTYIYIHTHTHIYTWLGKHHLKDKMVTLSLNKKPGAYRDQETKR